jgi:hypothetical protein
MGYTFEFESGENRTFAVEGHRHSTQLGGGKETDLDEDITIRYDGRTMKIVNGKLTANGKELGEVKPGDRITFTESGGVFIKAPGVAEADSSRPRYESELSYSHTVNGGKSSGTDRGTRYTDGKPFRVVDKFVLASGDPKDAFHIRIEVGFVVHRSGKDLYRVSYTARKGGGLQTTTSEMQYDGRRLVLIEDENCTVVLQPPTADAPADEGSQNAKPGPAADGRAECHAPYVGMAS